MNETFMHTPGQMVIAILERKKQGNSNLRTFKATDYMGIEN